ncbi:hypothetical protein C1646_777129, partial [Rhizophagus diaphanus]
IERAIRLGYNKEVLVVEFWKKYNELENRSDEKLKEELDEWIEIKTRENNEMIIKYRQIINNLNIELQPEAIWILYSFGFNEEDIGNRRFIREYVRLLKMYCEGRVNEVNKAIVRERLRELIEEGGKTEIAEWLEKAQEIGVRVTESELSTLWNMGYNEEEVFMEGFIGKFQEIKDELKTFVMKELDRWLIQERKRKEPKDESDDEKDEKEEIVMSMYERLSGTENELTRADIRRILELGFDHDLSDTEVPITPIITMATEEQVRRLMERALGLPDNSLRNPLPAGTDIAG